MNLHFSMCMNYVTNVDVALKVAVNLQFYQFIPSRHVALQLQHTNTETSNQICAHHSRAFT